MFWVVKRGLKFPICTRIVHVRQGFEFLGYKVKQGKGLRLLIFPQTRIDVKVVTMIGTKRAISSRHNHAIVEVSRNDLRPGVLAELFAESTRAVILKHDTRVSEIWAQLQPTQNGDTLPNVDNGPFWDDGILSLARNHMAGNLRVGDMLRFTANTIGHIARKVKVYKESSSGAIRVNPEAFWRGNYLVTFPQGAAVAAWGLMSDILRSSLPAESEVGDYAVAIERLKYPTSDELEMIFQLLGDSSEGWTRLGRKLDSLRPLARGPFSQFGMRDLFAWGSLTPGIRYLVKGMNAVWGSRVEEDMPKNTRIIGAEHVDGSKVVTALASDRDGLVTQVRDGSSWYDLPLSPDTLAVLPCKGIPVESSITPTTHRILIRTNERDRSRTKCNVTLALAVVDSRH